MVERLLITSTISLLMIATGLSWNSNIAIVQDMDTQIIAVNGY